MKKIVFFTMLVLFLSASFLSPQSKSEGNESLAKQKINDLDKLDKRDEIRNKRNKLSNVLDIVGVNKGMVVGEVGAGRGFFTLMLAERIGENGKVYANDIFDENVLSILRRRAESRGLKNVVTILGKETDPLLPKNKLEMVFIVIAFHDFTKPLEMIKNIEKSLKVGGKLIIVDPEKSGTEASQHFYSRKEFLDIFSKTTLKVISIDDNSLPDPYVIYVLSK